MRWWTHAGQDREYEVVPVVEAMLVGADQLRSDETPWVDAKRARLQGLRSELLLAAAPEQ